MSLGKERGDLIIRHQIGYQIWDIFHGRANIILLQLKTLLNSNYCDASTYTESNNACHIMNLHDQRFFAEKTGGYPSRSRHIVISKSIQKILNGKNLLAKMANYQPISCLEYRTSGTETVDSGSISGQVKPKTIKIGIYSFRA